MRNFEADRLVRVGDVVDLVRNTFGKAVSIPVDFGDAGYHDVDADFSETFGELEQKILDLAERG